MPTRQCRRRSWPRRRTSARRPRGYPYRTPCQVRATPRHPCRQRGAPSSRLWCGVPSRMTCAGPRLYLPRPQVRAHGVRRVCARGGGRRSPRARSRSPIRHSSCCVQYASPRHPSPPPAREPDVRPCGTPHHKGRPVYRPSNTLFAPRTPRTAGRRASPSRSRPAPNRIREPKARYSPYYVKFCYLRRQS